MLTDKQKEILASMEKNARRRKAKIDYIASNTKRKYKIRGITKERQWIRREK